MFEQFLPRLEEKLDSYVFAIQNLQAKLDYHQRVADSLARTIKSENRAIAWLKSKLQDFMQLRVERLGVRGKRLEGKITKVTLCLNGGAPPLWHDPNLDIEDFPEEAIDYVPTLNKTRLRSLVEQSGGELVVGGRAIARIDPRGSHLRF
jgi:hypothetical protein